MSRASMQQGRFVFLCKLEHSLVFVNLYLCVCKDMCNILITSGVSIQRCWTERDTFECLCKSDDSQFIHVFCIYVSVCIFICVFEI